MKKYPFSNKAVKAMLAATVAFSPLAASAYLFDAPVAQAEAAVSKHYEDAAAMAAFTKRVYDRLEKNHRSTLLALQAIENNEWKDILNPISSDKATGLNGASIAMLTLLLDKGDGSFTGDASAVKTELENVALAFNTEYKLVGNEAVSVTDILNYLESLEATLYAKAKNGQTDLSVTMKAAVEDTTDPSGKIKHRLAADVDVTTENVFDVADNLSKEVSLSEVLAALNAFQSVWFDELSKDEPVVVTPPGGGAVPPTTDGGEVVAPEKPGEEVIVDPIVVEMDNALIAKIPTELAQQIVSVVTATTPSVKIALPSPVAGKKLAVDLPSGLVRQLEGKNPNLVVDVTAEKASYSLPVAEVDFVQIAEDLDVSVDDVSIRVSINEASAAISGKVLAEITERRGRMLAPVIDFSVEAVVDDYAHYIESFGNTYVSRTINLYSEVDRTHATGALYDPTTGTVSFVPTLFSRVEDRLTAVLKRNANSLYTVVEGDMTFPDVDGKNWAEGYIESLASKYVISGYTDGEFKPGRDLNRGEFVLLLTRSLGLQGTAYDGRFSDVAGTELFNQNDAVMAAVDAGLINGYPDGTFRASEKISREQATALIGRALESELLDFDADKYDTDKSLQDFGDLRGFSSTLREDVEKAYQAGIVNGKASGNFVPTESTKRDQMAKILYEFMLAAELTEVEED